jgi:hypothetical protein
MLPSKFMKQGDFPQPALVYLSHITKEQFNQENEPIEHKWCAHFREHRKCRRLVPDRDHW